MIYNEFTSVQIMNPLKIDEIQKYLQQYIKGQQQAIRLISILLINRERIEKLKLNNIEIDYPKEELTPPNILLTGPSGSGKTELTKKIAKICNRFWFRIPCTVFSSTGYIGKNTEDVLIYSIESAMQKLQEKYKEQIYDNLEKLLLNAMKPPIIHKAFVQNIKKYVEIYKETPENEELDEQVHATIPVIKYEQHGAFLTQQPVQDSIRNVIDAVIEGELSKCQDEILKEAIRQVENGIIMLDEVDKIVGGKTDNVSMYGVQRELLAIVEGSTFHTKYDTIDTKNILFIAAGAFQAVSINEMLPELRGRFPVLIELKPLTKEDFIEILKHSKLSPLKKYQSIMKADNINVIFTDDAIDFLAEYAIELNKKEQLGARRLWELFDKYLIDLYVLNEDTTVTKEILEEMLNIHCQIKTEITNQYKEIPIEMYI